MNCEMSHPEIRPISAEPEPAAEFHSASSNGTSCQSLQLRESRNGKEITRGWITEAEWTIYIKENSIDDPRSPSVVSIFEVPYFLRKSKIEFYVPQTVSLGPYHHRSAELHDLMSSHKGRALHLMRTRFNNNRNLANVDPNNMDFALDNMNECTAFLHLRSISIAAEEYTLDDLPEARSNGLAHHTVIVFYPGRQRSPVWHPWLSNYHPRSNQKYPWSPFDLCLINDQCWIEL